MHITDNALQHVRSRIQPYDGPLAEKVFGPRGTYIVLARYLYIA